MKTANSRTFNYTKVCMKCECAITKVVILMEQEYKGGDKIHIGIVFGLFFGLFMTGTIQSVGRAVHGSPGQFMHGPGLFMKRLFVMTGPEHMHGVKMHTTQGKGDHSGARFDLCTVYVCLVAD